MRDKGITADDATIALAGIFADTGSFTHSNVSVDDFRVAAFLLDSGASIQLVRTFLSPLREQLQVTTFHDVLGDLVHLNIRGHSVLLSHKKAASATLKGVVGVEVHEKLMAYLESSLRSAVTAEDLLTREVEVI